MFSFNVIVLGFTFTSLMYLNFCVRNEVGIRALFFLFFFSPPFDYPVVPMSFAEKTSLSLFNCFGTFVENQFDYICVVYF